MTPDDFFSRDRRPAPPRPVPVELDMVLEDPASGFVGAVIGFDRVGATWQVRLEDRRGAVKSFPLGPGFWLDGQPIEALPPQQRAAQPSGLHVGHGGRRLTNSGSRAVASPRARTARASRIWVEGRHDAELIQHVWGDDLAAEGVAVVLLEGADHLDEVLTQFGPTDTERAGVLLDHLVAGSKETRIADAARRRWPEGLLILGHPFVDVWQAVKPTLFGLEQWAPVPRGTDIKVGTLQALGWPSSTPRDVAAGWQKILGRVRTYRDLEPALLGPVEALIDFVTEPGTL